MEVIVPNGAVMHGAGTVTTAGTSVQLDSSTTAPNDSITIRASTGNSDVIYVGGPDVDSTNGYVLAAGEPSPPLHVSPSEIWIDCASNGDGFTWIGS